ncbi:hypothetical protein UR09_00865 [Candidatus Nitromaritima sp. SCGC AAA799-A02]|nr:hypothetical protein UZ36_07620 [Candidatus Nitromaritima sp. SCGC AAA799-C22]KMP12610.1 hypothetical protein UR09_00865 [Candidatus Nitromaritima sp. SCGC AAA799-A02]
MNIGKLIAVIGSGSERHPHLCGPLGRGLAEKGYSLINGAGGGVMAETAHAFCSVENRKGLVVGVVPSNTPCLTPQERAVYTTPPGYPNSYTELVIRTHLHLSGTMGKDVASRNHIIVLSASAVVALPGGPGTRSEIELALEYKKHLILLSPNGEWDPFAGRASAVKTVEDAVGML